MKRKPSVFILTTLISSFFLSSCTVSKLPEELRPAVQQITPTLMQQHIDFLASDSLKGRSTPGPGLDTAAWYIARTFRDMGLEPVNGSYFQEIPFCTKDLGTDTYLRVTVSDSTKEIPLKQGFIPYESQSSLEAIGDMVFAGYGITAPEYDYDDYARLDVKGKIVMVFRYEPRDEDSTSVFGGSSQTEHALIGTKVSNAAAHGAAGIIVVNGPLNFISLRPTGYNWTALSKVMTKAMAPMQVCAPPEKEIPAFHAGEELVSLLFGSVDSLGRIQHLIDSSMQPHSFALSAGARMKITVEAHTELARNVTGYLPGSDPVLKNQLVIVGAHYDHIGFRKKHGPGEDYIMNGADDNASGTAGVMAIARACCNMKVKPRRSILFIAFCGEEKGLLGSAYYTNHPLFPLDSTAAMLNLDMISRNHRDSLFIVGRKYSPDIYDIILENNRYTGLNITPRKNEFMGGSDHFSFYLKDIPFAFFFTGLHKDYHTVRDNPDKIIASKAARVARLAFLTTWQIANENKKYALKNNEDEN